MAGLKIYIHPLFYIFGLYFALSGKVFSFLICTITAIVHEMGHSYVSEELGYKLKRVVLMPYGAVISGDLSGLKYRDEIRIALAGPLLNLGIGLFFTALWWLVPEIYPYTESVVYSNVSIALINFIPAYPLDGGRILLSTLSLYVCRKTAIKAVKITGIIFTAILLCLFVISCFYAVNFTFLFFASFVFAGLIDKNGENTYIRIYSNLYESSLKRGCEVKKLALLKTTPVKRITKLIDSDCLYEIEVMTGGAKTIKTMSVSDVANMLEKASPYDCLGDYLNVCSNVAEK